jgi:LacI family transcriptional regulator
MAAKYIEIAEIIRCRILRGDYVVSPFPGQPTLAKELGVSYLTARKAVSKLIREGVLQREYNGRVQIPSKHTAIEKRPLNIAFLVPPSVICGDWYPPLQHATVAYGGSVRMLPYLDWSDQNVYDAIGGQYDGAFIIPQHDIPRLVMDQLIENSYRVITLFEDFTEYGIPCIDQTPEHGAFRLVEHLVSLGHRSIDCFNAEPRFKQIEHYIDCWRDALAYFEVQGILRDVSEKPDGDSSMRAYRGMKGLPPVRDWNATAVLSTSVRCVQGFYRAVYEQDLKIGKDISICALGSPEVCQIMIPSLTGEKNPDREPFLSKGLEWILSGGKNWSGSIHICPEEAELFKGESTGPAPEK